MPDIHRIVLGSWPHNAFKINGEALMQLEAQDYFAISVLLTSTASFTVKYTIKKSPFSADLLQKGCWSGRTEPPRAPCSDPAPSSAQHSWAKTAHAVSRSDSVGRHSMARENAEASSDVVTSSMLSRLVRGATYKASMASVHLRCWNGSRNMSQGVSRPSSAMHTWST